MALQSIKILKIISSEAPRKSHRHSHTMSNYKERGRMELAQLYFPQLGGIAAWKKLQHWINICQPLKDELRQLGYTGKQRTFTPRQVNRIVHYLGEY